MEKDKDGFYLVPIFNGSSNRLGHTYDSVAQAVRAAFEKGNLPVTIGDTGSKVDIERVCGIIHEPVFLEEAEIIQGKFKASPSNTDFIDKLIAHQPASFSICQGSPRFGIRGQGTVDKNGKHTIDRIISIDLLAE